MGVFILSFFVSTFTWDFVTMVNSIGIFTYLHTRLTEKEKKKENLLSRADFLFSVA